MAQKMLINARDPEELRAAVVEDGVLEAFYVEALNAEQTRGNIYKGVVNNVETSLDAAFIEYGQGRHGFLQASDLEPGLWAGKDKLPPIKDILRKGQQVLVQVVKEPQGSKGAALTTYLSIPGQALVLTMGRHLSGVSRKVETESERKRLREVVSSFDLPANMGVIARTAALGRTKRDLQTTLRQQLRVFEDVLKKGEKASAPSLVHKEESLAVRTVRDLFTNDIDEILVDDPGIYEQLKSFIFLVNPKRKKDLYLYKESRPIFSKYNLEQQIESIYSPRVVLQSGASLVINPTEALVAIDVNSGKAIKGKQIGDTALSVNLEAAREIARQLRLRDLGGLVVIDFIDMKEAKNRTQVQKELKEALKKDKAKVDVGRLSRFGLLEVSRQRIRPPIEFGEVCVCPLCQGRGVMRTLEAEVRHLWRAVSGKLNKSSRLEVNPAVAVYLLNQKRGKLAALEEARNICVEVIPNQALGASQWRIEPLLDEWIRPALTEKVVALPYKTDQSSRREDYKPSERNKFAETRTADRKEPVQAEPLKTEPETTALPETKNKPARAGRYKRPNRQTSSQTSSQANSKPAQAKAKKSAKDMVEALASSPIATELLPNVNNGETAVSNENSEIKRQGSKRSGAARRRSRRQKQASMNGNAKPAKSEEGLSPSE